MTKTILSDQQTAQYAQLRADALRQIAAYDLSEESCRPSFTDFVNQDFATNKPVASGYLNSYGALPELQVPLLFFERF